MITGFSEGKEEYILDGDEMAAYEELVSAARAVIKNWSSGDLAGAVNRLEGAIECVDGPEEGDNEASA